MTIVKKDILMKDPAAVFDSPAELVESDELFKAQKIAVLEQWKDEIEKHMDAEAEAMPGNSENAEKLQQVSDALISLRHDVEVVSRRIPAPGTPD